MQEALVIFPSEQADLWAGLLETVILALYHVWVEGAATCSQSSMIATRFSQKGLCHEGGCESDSCNGAVNKTPAH